MKTAIILTAFTLLFAANVIGQKLPNKQEVSFRAPAKLKIDGIATEWGNKLQAYNKSTQIFYAISNDDKNLYLIVQAKYEEIINKIIRGGITLIINHSINKKDPQPVTVTYPVLRGSDMSRIANGIVGRFYKQPDTSYKPVTITELNNRLDAGSKTIITTGIKNLDSDTLSVYNTDGIKAAAQFDNNTLYNYELAIPIKYLDLPNNGVDPFSYQLKVNGLPEQVYTHNDSSSSSAAPPPYDATTALATTDFWAQYTLAK
ncbi:hypothetical protein FO440_12650 [Mucilaginibacter corticis]|uniref:Uncharacterized protein n=1 Tax=Mucilaginibacter corticis TaxID=2597670 RepID=A0A556ML25_9SPHI|nr:hypothetical protein [Mucilaginibacter corticis]TSJ40593.1 hypothetical protein FO440_12650 [Mucilaginibacter corticis]